LNTLVKRDETKDPARYDGVDLFVSVHTPHILWIKQDHVSIAPG
jgi:hypothetical protein